MWQIPTHQFVEFTESLGAEIQIVLYNFGLFSNWHGGSFVSFPLAMRSRLPPALPFAFCLEDTAEIQKLGSQHVFPLSLTPIFFNSLKRLLTPDREAEERAGLRPGPCGILSTVDCPPRPNPRPPRSSRPHPPPSWSGAHTDTQSLIDCNQCGNTYSSKSSEDNRSTDHLATTRSKKI